MADPAPEDAVRTDRLDADIEAVHRREYPRALATIARMTGDLDLAEDAVQEAFGVALRRWPADGLPDNPGAWITTTARNRALDVLRREAARGDRERGAALASLHDSAPELHPVADDQLRLIFLTCHPALPDETRIVLTLRFVFGLRVPEIARVLLQGEAGVAKRLQRGRKKARDARIPVRLPDRDRLGERLPIVIECLYLVFTEGYAATDEDALIRRDLCDEAIRLGRLLAAHAPDDAGPHALLALMLLQDSRADARLDERGDVVLLADQDRGRWRSDRIEEGLAQLALARRSRLGAGRAARSYVLQASVAAHHATSPEWEATDWAGIVRNYDELLALTASPVVALNRTVAVSFASGPADALSLLDELAADPRLSGSHHLPSVRGDLLRRLDRRAEAADAYRRALERVGTRPEREFLERRLDELA